MPGPRPILCTSPDAFLQVALDTVSRRTDLLNWLKRAAPHFLAAFAA